MTEPKNQCKCSFMEETRTLDKDAWFERMEAL